jgi:hypothetical protein
MKLQIRDYSFFGAPYARRYEAEYAPQSRASVPGARLEGGRLGKRRWIKSSVIARFWNGLKPLVDHYAPRLHASIDLSLFKYIDAETKLPENVG